MGISGRAARKRTKVDESEQYRGAPVISFDLLRRNASRVKWERMKTAGNSVKMRLLT
jgi:hypothetical protein